MIIRTLWEYGLNAYSLCTLIFEDGREHYRLVTPHRVCDGMSKKEYEWYMKWIRTPYIRDSGLSDVYTLRIMKIDTKTGAIIKEYYSK